jgi:hypothetical protein
MKKVSLVAVFIAAAALSACDNDKPAEDVIVAEEPCEDTGACEPTD